MKRLLFLLVCVITSLTLICSAHSGGTDDNGGHYSPDGYHYHHGYPAHQHTNGRCPFDYDDRTGEDSGTSSGDNNSSVSSGNSFSDNGSTTSDPKDPKQLSVLEWILRIIAVLLLGPPMLVLCILFFVVPFLIPILKLLGKRDKKYIGKTRTEIAKMCGMPDLYYMDDNELPHEKNSDPSCDHLTVYMEMYRRVYHATPLCTYSPTKPINMTQLHFCWACKKCKPPDIDLSWYNSYLDAREFMKRHGIEPVPETDAARIT